MVCGSHGVYRDHCTRTLRSITGRRCSCCRAIDPAGVVVQIDESLFRHKPKVQVSFVTAVVWEVTTIIIVAWVYIYKSF